MENLMDNLVIFEYSTLDELQDKLGQFNLDDTEQKYPDEYEEPDVHNALQTQVKTTSAVVAAVKPP